MRLTRWLVAGMAVVLAASCASPRSSLNTAGGTCFRALAAAEDAVHHKGRFVGVRHVDTADLAKRVPEAAALEHRRLCGVAYRADYQPGEVNGADPARAGRYAIVLVDDEGQHVVAAYVLDKLPMRFSHRI